MGTDDSLGDNMTENFSLKALVGLSDVISYYWAKSIV